ncbi:MAG: anaerobic ribonucleoside-triphosphate reductase activating protein [Candidatus Pacebacteria bacterium]|nr:anaerobic ribonucleoside-triphosphate reductase activating protein [Candidatus Paceibacterota bacterium]
MTIGGLQKVTLIDYPGKIACTVFLTRCNFRCPFCYSKELVLEEEIKKQPQTGIEDFFSFLEEKKGLLDACVICGGEPTLALELKDFLKRIKEMGFLVKIDTNGYLPEKLKELIEEKLVDYIAMDIKAPLDKEKYGQATGIDVDIERIKKSIELIKNSGIDYEFRTTVVPGLHRKQDIIEMARAIGPAKKYFLQNFRGEKGTIDPSLEGKRAFDEEEIKEAMKEIASLFEVCKLR